jgi:hypothetical protein
MCGRSTARSITATARGASGERRLDVAAVRVHGRRRGRRPRRDAHPSDWQLGDVLRWCQHARLRPRVLLPRRRAGDVREASPHPSTCVTTSARGRPPSWGRTRPPCAPMRRGGRFSFLPPAKIPRTSDLYKCHVAARAINDRLVPMYQGNDLTGHGGTPDRGARLARANAAARLIPSKEGTANGGERCTTL